MGQQKNRQISAFWKPGLALILAVLALMFFLSGQGPRQDVKQQVFSTLNKVRASKKQEIISYFNEIESLARSIRNDQEMLGYFEVLQNGADNPGLEFQVDKHYVNKYGNFYDILFVDAGGYVFHSIRKEADYHKNLLAPDMSGTRLAQSLKRPGDEQFSEFEYYPPSDEPAAFFSIALHKAGKLQGWLILQCATNNVNAILTDREDLGRTGEVYLVNTESLMLSDSRFMDDSTILRQKIDTFAVKEAMQHDSGEKIIEDYRGVRVFSSFEKFDLFGISWIIIAEIDEDEVITEHYKRHKKYFQREFARYLAARPRRDLGRQKNSLKTKRVDINEFARAEAGTVLSTHGVATCTAVAISYPGRFAYLVHISPTDEIYMTDKLTRFFLRNNYHNFLDKLLDRINFFEIYPYELKKLHFTVAAPHHRSFAKAVDAILAHNIELSNIKFLYNPKALSVDVIMAGAGDSLVARWNEDQQTISEDAAGVEDLGAILKKIIQYEG